MDSTLDRWLKRLMLVRVVMITTLLLIAIYVESVSETLLAVNPLYALIAGTYGLTILYVLLLRLLRSRQPLIWMQAVMDVVLVTGLVYVTGGTSARNSFMLLYPIAVLSGSVFLNRRSGLLLATIATAMYAGMLWGLRAHVLPVPPFSDIASMSARALQYIVFVTGVACGTVALIGSYLSEALRHAGQALQQAAGQVADLREFNELIVNSIPSGLATTDSDGRLLYVNAVGGTLLGVERSGLVGRSLRDVFGTVLLDGSVLLARAAQGHLGRFEFVYRHPDGQERDLGVTVTRLAVSDPGRGGFLLVFQNLTEVKRREREVSIREKLAAVGEMAAQLAHEIRNPLGSISGSAQVLLAEQGVSGEQERLLSIITKESRRLSDALNQFLLQTRLPPINRGPVDVGRAVHDAVTLLRNGPEVKAHHQLEFEVMGGPHVSLADPDQIKQVFWNLARNGLEAMPEGGQLNIRLAADGDDLVLSFRDQGRGMGREEQRRIFEPFQSGTPMGTGLGLAIVYRIVRDHRGDITVRSTPTQGTEVEVRLPLVASPTS
jgi:two-component system sensor histidine kinase PilS (NtrC family)